MMDSVSNSDTMNRSSNKIQLPKVEMKSETRYRSLEKIPTIKKKIKTEFQFDSINQNLTTNIELKRSSVIPTNKNKVTKRNQKVL
jgi:hypothetical protein